jgi:hypothetical protein
MTGRIAFLHTAQLHVPRFERLVRELAPGVEAGHLVREDLLHEARSAGIDHPALPAKVHDAMRAAAAADGAAVVVCTCSTLGGIAERTATGGAFAAQRIDRAMADRAVRMGPRVLVTAALESTLEPTRALVLSAAALAGVGVRPTPLLVDGAWEHFEAGDTARYIEVLAGPIRDAASAADVVVLAQASMAPVADELADLGIEVLSSPRLGVAHALATLRAANRAWSADPHGRALNLP